jgi:hypothetical protein
MHIVVGTIFVRASVAVIGALCVGICGIGVCIGVIDVRAISVIAAVGRLIVLMSLR